MSRIPQLWSSRDAKCPLFSCTHKIFSFYNDPFYISIPKVSVCILHQSFASTTYASDAVTPIFHLVDGWGLLRYIGVKVQQNSRFPDQKLPSYWGGDISPTLGTSLPPIPNPSSAPRPVFSLSIIRNHSSGQ